MSAAMPQASGADPRPFWNDSISWKTTPTISLKAQRAKWLKLVENCGPRKKLPQGMVAKNGSKLPLYHHGIPFTDQYMFEYAQRLHITLRLSPETGKFFDGSPVLDYLKLTLEQEPDAELMVEWDGMMSLWSNYDLNDPYSRLVVTLERFKNIATKLKEAMYEGGQKNEPEWQYE
ncbi:hypothetical protein V8D89_000236 [Ganoderma adspersum]